MSKNQKYKHEEWYLKQKAKDKKRYYSKGYQARNGKKWTEEEIRLIAYSKLTDTELSKLLKRSIRSIQGKRVIIRRTYPNVVFKGNKSENGK